MQLAKSNVKVYGLQLRVSAIGFINKVLAIYIGKELSAHVELFLKKEGRYKGNNAALRDFCNKYNISIDEDISLDALQKLSFRSRKYLNKSVADLS